MTRCHLKNDRSLAVALLVGVGSRLLAAIMVVVILLENVSLHADIPRIISHFELHSMDIGGSIRVSCRSLHGSIGCEQKSFTLVWR